MGCLAVDVIPSEDAPGGAVEETERPPGRTETGVPPEAPPDDTVEDLPVDDADAAAILWGETTAAFALEVDDEALDALEADPETDVPAVFSYQGHTWIVGLHLKGTRSFRTMDEKASFKMDFGAYDGPDFHGVRRLTLNNMVQDGTMLREHAAYWLSGALGAPAPRHGYAVVTVNGEPYGLYGVIETMDRAFLRQTWPTDAEGWLYESVNGAGEFIPGREDNYAVQAAGTGEEYADLRELIQALDDADDRGDFLGELEDRFADDVFTALALDIAIGNSDGYTFSTNNYLAYHAPIADRFSVVPWGTDQAFRVATDPYDSGYDPVTEENWGPDGRLVIDCLAESGCRARLEVALRDVADVWGEGGFEAAMRETAERIAVDCEEDPRREHSCAPESLFDFMEPRLVQLRGWVD